MHFHVVRKASIPCALFLPVFAGLAFAQRSQVPAATAPIQDPQLKLPASPSSAAQVTVRQAQRVQTGAPLSTVKGSGLDPQHTSYRNPSDQLYLSAQEDSSPQVRARSFKAEFRADGATYIPFCGSAAPQNHPLSFRIQDIRAGEQPVAFSSSVLAGLQGRTVRYERGGVTETYQIGLDSLEQTFVFSSLPAAGDLVLQLGVTTELEAGYDGGAIVYRSSDGSVRYGAATVIDAHGVRAPAGTELTAAGLQIRVPAEFLASAAFPITIDPVISTFGVAWLTEPVDSFAPAIAWDESNQRYCIAFEQVFSAGDHDVVRSFVSPAGAFQSASYLDTSLTAYWANPDVANNNQFNNFLVVAEVGAPTGGLREIHGHLVDAATAAAGADILISTTDATGEKINASVGGDPFGSGTVNYAVVWQRIFIVGSDDDVHFRYVTPAGVLVGTGTGLLDNSGSTLDRDPRISKSCQGAGTHHVVWTREVSATNRDLYAAQLDFLGAITLPSTAIDTSTGDTTAPACSSMLDTSGQWLLVYEYDFGTDHDILAYLLSGVTINDSVSLSGLESSFGSGTFFEDQRHPAAESDGSRFGFSYAESFLGSTTDYDIYVSTLDVINGQLMLGESHRNLAFSGTHEDFPRMCANEGKGGAPWRMGIVWSDTGGTNLGDIEGALYDVDDFTPFCFPGFDGVMTCPCGNTTFTPGKGCDNSNATGGASLNQFGTASVGADTAVLFTAGEMPTALSIVAQGPGLLPAGVAFGQGVRCVGASGGIGLKRLYTKNAVGGAISAPAAGDASISARSAALGDPLSAGTIRYYYVYYRDPTVLGGCLATSTFNSTDSGMMTWRP